MSIQYICVFHHKLFSQISQLLFLMFQCYEHVKMNKLLCSLACTWIAIIDRQFYIIDSLSFRCFIGMKRYLGGCLVVKVRKKIASHICATCWLKTEWNESTLNVLQFVLITTRQIAGYKDVVRELKLGNIAVIQKINNLPYFNTDWQFGMFKRREDNGRDTW